MAQRPMKHSYQKCRKSSTGSLQLGHSDSIIFSLIILEVSMKADELNLSRRCFTLLGNLESRIVLAPREIFFRLKLQPLFLNFLRIVFSLSSHILVVALVTTFIKDCVLLVSVLIEIWFSRMSELFVPISEKISAFSARMLQSLLVSRKFILLVSRKL